MKDGDEDWVQFEEDINLSGLHHNNLGGFFALRPAYLLSGGAQMKEFNYKPL